MNVNLTTFLDVMRIDLRASDISFCFQIIRYRAFRGFNLFHPYTIYMLSAQRNHPAKALNIYYFHMGCAMRINEKIALQHYIHLCCSAIVFSHESMSS